MKISKFSHKKRKKGTQNHNFPFSRLNLRFSTCLWRSKLHSAAFCFMSDFMRKHVSCRRINSTLSFMTSQESVKFSSKISIENFHQIWHKILSLCSVLIRVCEWKISISYSNSGTSSFPSRRVWNSSLGKRKTNGIFIA